jgi:hypothetical protein
LHDAEALGKQLTDQSEEHEKRLAARRIADGCNPARSQ